MVLMIHKTFLFLFFVVVSPLALSQDIYLKHYSTESGLPSSTVYSVFQQKNGFIWFCMDVGVCRFDGKQYELFTTEDGLPGNEVFGIFEDSKGRLWFRTLNGQIGYYSDDEFFKTEFRTNKRSPGSGYISAISEDWNGNLYFTTGGGYLLMLGPDSKMKTLHLEDIFVGVFSWPKEKKTYLVGGNGIYELEQPLSIKKRIVNLESKLFHKRAFQDGHYIYYTNGGEQYRFNILNESIEYLGATSTDIISFTADDKYGYIGTRSGLVRYPIEQNGEFSSLNEEQLGAKEISSVLNDQEGNIWISTLHDGVFMGPRKSIFHVNRISSPVLSLYNDNDEILYAGSIRGTYYQIDSDNRIREKVNLKTSAGQSEIIGFQKIENDFWIIGKHAFTIKSNSGDETYFPFGGNGILKYNDENHLWLNHKTVLLFPTEKLKNYLIRKQSLNDRWLHRKLSNEINADPEIPEVFYERVYCYFQDQTSDTLWLGTENGLFLSTNDIHKQQLFKLLGAIRVTDITKLKNKQLMALATDGKGVVFTNGRQIVQQIGTLKGLLSNSVRCIEQDKDTLWVGTQKGLCKLYHEEDRLKVIPMSFPGNIKINDIKIFNSKIYVATENGIEYFDRNSTEATSPPLVFIKNATSGKQVLTKDYFQIEYAQNSVRFEFTGLSYKNFGQVNFEYRLVGYNNNWKRTESRVIEYSALPAGTYVFEVRSIDANGVPSLSTARSKFVVLQPYWQKTWFILSVLLALFLSIVLIWRTRMKFYHQKLALAEHEKQQIEIERNLVELEQQALRMQMNPHFIFNALNTIKGFYVEKNAVQAKKYINVFSKLMRAILDTTSDLISIDDECTILELYLQLSRIRYEDKFTYEIIIDPALDTEALTLPPMLFQPFVENAIIHGLVSKKTPGHVKITFSCSNEQLIITIEDNGIGRKNAAEINKYKNYTSKATDIIEKRLWYLSQKIGKNFQLKITDLNQKSDETGTLVTISLPKITIT